MDSEASLHRPCVNTSNNEKATGDTEGSAIGSGGMWDSSALAVRDNHTKSLVCVSPGSEVVGRRQPRQKEKHLSLWVIPLTGLGTRE